MHLIKVDGIVLIIARHLGLVDRHDSGSHYIQRCFGEGSGGIANEEDSYHTVKREDLIPERSLGNV